MYVEVILPVPLADTYTYFVPPILEAQIVSGGLVSVDFGKNQYIGIIHSIHNTPPIHIKNIKPITGVESLQAVVRDYQFTFWKWISEYYLCKLGDVYKAVIPSGYRTGKTPRKKRKEKETAAETMPLKQLNDLQQQVFHEINEGLKEKDVCLLHGVTSSGKTEIYTHFIQKALDRGEQVLYLLPEIALTAQITARLKRFFGDQLNIYHSKVSNNERIHLWNQLLNEEGGGIILGVRSSVFLPFRKLGLVIIDEEHEPSYKQQEPAPRYHGRNAAIVLAKMHNAKVILGSATPSVESYYNARIGKYAYARLEKRFEDTELPRIVPVDVKELRRKKIMKGIFSPPLIEKMTEVLEKKEQVLLFQNRRGFAAAITCRICDWTPKCRFCDISLTSHRADHKEHLSCHYCGRSFQVPKVCPECGSTELRALGFGTEKVEEDIRERFPEVTVERMDADSTHTRRAMEGLIGRFENGETQVLIGTQMISKGLDFANVSLVGILNADGLMNFPDFRSYERAYQLMTQVSGRAGRRKERGEVILQTSHPDHPLIQEVIAQEYDEMFNMQIEERRLFRYPPFVRLIYINIRHRKEELLNEIAREYARLLQIRLGDRVIGPDKPLAGHIQKTYIRRVLLKVELTASMSTLSSILTEVQAQILSNRDYRYTTFIYDTDPV